MREQEGGRETVATEAPHNSEQKYRLAVWQGAPGDGKGQGRTQDGLGDSGVTKGPRAPGTHSQFQSRLPTGVLAGGLGAPG